MTRKNINVTEVVHEALSVRKRTEETFDEVLKRELDLWPGGLEELVAFYPEGLAAVVREVVGRFEQMVPVETVIVEREGTYVLELIHPESSHTIAEAWFWEDPREGLEAFYRDQQGEMRELVRVYMADAGEPPVTVTYVGPAQVTLETATLEVDAWVDQLDMETDLEPRLQTKLRGAYERWG